MARVSIKDVAERAGVSIATVSHVINETRFVREETRQKVLEAVKALNYQPNIIARGLVTNSTQTIGLVVSDIRNPFFTAVARGVEDEFSQRGYHTIFCNTDEDPTREDEYLRLLSGRQIDGLIIAPTGALSERLIQMAEAKLPVILLDRTTPGIKAPLIAVDNEGGAYQAVQYLIDLGHRRIAVLAGLATMSTMRKRIYGYKQALEKAGIPVDDDLIVYADPRFYSNHLSAIDSPSESATDNQPISSSYHGLKRLFDLPEPPSAIFVANNQMMLGVLHALKDNDLHCPADISLVCFDDPDWASIFSPSLTVVQQPTYQLGQTSAQLLFELMNNQPIEFPPPLSVKLIVRESCRRL